MPPLGGQLRILLLIDSLQAAGAEQSLLGVAPLLRSRGILTEFGLLRDTMPAADQTGTWLVPGDSRVGRVRALRRILRRERFDLLHTTLFEADLVGRVAARLEGVPVVSSLVNTPYTDPARAAEPVPSWKLRSVQLVDGLLARHATTAFHAISHTVADAAVRDLRVPAECVTVVPRGRDPFRLGQRTPHRRAAVRERLGVSEDQPVILNVAREEPQKNQAVLFEALSRVRERLPSTVLVLAGRPGRASTALTECAKRLALPEESVRRLGARDDVPDLLAAADVFAFPSRWEGLGGAVLEAMGVGIPVVASDIPAMREVLAGGRAGALAPPGDGDAWAEWLTVVLEGSPDAVARARVAHERFQAHYTLEPSADGLAALYHRVAASDAYRGPSPPGSASSPRSTRR